jgi:hypothetical protein
METMESRHESCTFIIRIWREPREEQGARTLWRGVIEQIPSGQRQSIHSLNDIENFIIPYLKAFNLRTGFWWRARHSLRQLF